MSARVQALLLGLFLMMGSLKSELNTQVEYFKASELREIGTSSVQDRYLKEQAHQDVILWQKLNRLRASTPELDAELHERWGYTDRRTTPNHQTNKSLQESVDKFFRISFDMSPGAQLLEITLREIGRQVEIVNHSTSCSETPKLVYMLLRTYVNDIMKIENFEHSDKGGKMLGKLPGRRHECFMLTPNSQMKLQESELLSDRPLREKVKAIISAQNSARIRELVHWNRMAVVEGLRQCLGEIELHEVEFRTLPHSGEKSQAWFKLRTDVEKVVFGAINYMYQFNLIDKDQMEEFFMHELAVCEQQIEDLFINESRTDKEKMRMKKRMKAMFSNGPSVMEVFGNHLHNVHQLSQVSHFEPTVEFLSDKHHATWYIGKCLKGKPIPSKKINNSCPHEEICSFEILGIDKLLFSHVPPWKNTQQVMRKSCQQVIIHAVLVKTCQSFMEHCTNRGILIENEFKEMVTLLTMTEFSGKIDKFETESLKTFLSKLFQNSLKYYESEVGGNFFFRNLCRFLGVSSRQPLFINLKKTQNISGQVKKTQQLINLYVLYYIINFWKPMVKQQITIDQSEFQKEISDNIVTSSGETITFFHPKEGLCTCIK